MYWLEISVQTDGEGAEAVAEMLRPFAYQESVVLEQRGDETNLDPAALEPGVAVKLYVPEDDDSPELRRRVEEVLYHLGRLYPLPPPIFRELRDEDWANAWKEHYRPFRLGRRLRIRPTGLAAEPGDDAPPDQVTLGLYPRIAFGTRLHPTTQSRLPGRADLGQPGAAALHPGPGAGGSRSLASGVGPGAPVLLRPRPRPSARRACRPSTSAARSPPLRRPRKGTRGRRSCGCTRPFRRPSTATSESAGCGRRSTSALRRCRRRGRRRGSPR